MFNIPTVTVAKTTLDETTASVTLDYAAPLGVSWTPRHLVVRVNAKTAYTGGDRDNVQLQFNGDTGSNYNVQYLSGVGSSYNAGRISAATTYLMGQTAADDAYWFAGGECLIPDALSTRTHKSIISFTGSHEDIVQTVAGRWANTAAITSVTFTCVQSPNQWLAGSTFELCVVDESFNIDQDGDGEQILGSAGTFSVGSIGAADGDLVQIGNLRSNLSAKSESFTHAINSDTTNANYATQYLYGSNTSVAAASVANRQIGNTAADSATASAFGGFVGQYTNFSDGSNDRSLLTLTGHHESSSPSSIVIMRSHRWNNVAAITSLLLSPNSGTGFVAGSMLSTYAVPKNLITRTELSGTVTSVTFADIPQTYDHLELSVYARTDRSSTEDTVKVEFNGDTTAANYDQQILLGADSGVTAAQSAASPSGIIVSANSAGANIFGSGAATIYNYTKTDRHKHWLGVSNKGANDVRIASQRWENTAAITSIVLDPANGTNFLAGSVFTLRGISADIPVASSDITKVNAIALADITAVN